MNKDLLRFTSIAAAVMLIIALYPQLSLWLSQGKNWNGSYAVSNYDETAYSAYVNSLIHGGSRKSDPFMKAGNIEVQPESLYSIQFIPAYAIAIPARISGISVSTTFIFLIAFLAVFASAALSCLFFQVTGDGLFSAVATLVVLCCGTAAAFQGELRHLIDGRVLVDFLPFLRRYQPGPSLPLFFLFVVCVRCAIASEQLRRAIYFSIAAGAVIAGLVFSYFYLWTAAVAWLICFGLIITAVKRDDSGRVGLVFLIITIFAAGSLVPYFYLLSLRAVNIDSIQLLVFSRMPDLTSPSMWIGLIVAVATLFRSANFDRRVLALILSFSLTPVILFNQQVVTGRLLQPIHYEIFFANYLVLIAAMLLLRSFVENASGAKFRRGLAYLGIAATMWGIFEAYGSTTRNSIATEIRDNSIPAIEYAAALDPNAVIHATNFVTADFVASASTARPLWNAHTSSAGGVDLTENKRLFYLYLYYSGFKPEDLENALRQNSFEVVSAIFGSERALPLLGTGSKPITSEEIQAETKKFADFAEKFDPHQASDPTLTSIIVPTEVETDLTNVDRWYERDEGKNFGMFTTYKLIPKFKTP